MPEIVGWDYVGDDDNVSGDDEVGADIVGAVQKAVRANKLPQSIVGAPLTNIPASSAGTTIQFRIQRDIRPDRLVLDRVQASMALVYQLSVGTVNLIASSDPVPGDMFAPDAVGTSFRAVETASPSIGITLVVGNRFAVQITSLAAGIVGPSMRAA